MYIIPEIYYCNVNEMILLNYKRLFTFSSPLNTHNIHSMKEIEIQRIVMIFNEDKL